MKPIYLLVRYPVESISKWQIWKYEFICKNINYIDNSPVVCLTVNTKFSVTDTILTEIVTECDSKEEATLNAAILGVDLWSLPNFAFFQSHLHLSIMQWSPDKIWNYFCSQLKKIEY